MSEMSQIASFLEEVRVNLEKDVFCTLENVKRMSHLDIAHPLLRESVYHRAQVKV